MAPLTRRARAPPLLLLLLPPLLLLLLDSAAAAAAATAPATAQQQQQPQQLFTDVFDEATCRFPALFAFGDSMTDTGNAQAVFPWQHAASLPPYGETYFGRATDRFSDGRLLVDFFSHALRLPLVDPYLRSLGTNFRRGANFATSGATVTNITFLVPYDFGVQAYWLDELRSRSLSSPAAGATLPTAADFADGLYFVAIGGNDYDAGVFLKMSTPALQAMTSQVVAQTLDGVRTLYASGARHFLFVNVPPIGCTPELLTLLPQGPPSDYDALGCHLGFNAVLSAHNAALRVGLAALRAQLPLAKFVYADYYNATLDITRRGAEYGFVNATHSCCGWGGKWNYDQRVGCSAQNVSVDGAPRSAGSCPDPDSFVNWDGIHPTEAFARVAARVFLNGDYIEPRDAFRNCSFDFSKFDQKWERAAAPQQQQQQEQH